MIILQDVIKLFGNKKVLDNFSLQVAQSETVVLFGPSGCGKTLLIKIILGLIKPDSGQVLLDGRRIDTMKENHLTEIRLKTGTLFQYYALFDSMTVSQNVGFYLKNHSNMTDSEIEKRVSEELERVNMTGNEHLKPAELSGGMQKRVGIARAIIHRPKIILYDSPTDGLDPVTSDRIIELIKSVNTNFNVTSLVISNDMNTAFRLADHMGMIYKGKLHAFGIPSEIVESTDPFVYQFIRGLGTGPLLKDEIRHSSKSFKDA
jgi:phospholipid/cholesterol/gamma-HCH transport system ATP-binding protein